VDVALMTAGEAWWNDYHAKVWEILAPQLSGATGMSAQCAPAVRRLRKACSPIVLATIRQSTRGNGHDRLCYTGHQRSGFGAVFYDAIAAEMGVGRMMGDEFIAWGDGRQAGHRPDPPLMATATWAMA
jgi:hypothetical protein